MLAILGGGFLDNAHGHFDPLNYFFGAGLGTNIGASVVCACVAAWKIRKMWRAHRQRQHERDEWQARHTKRLLEHHGVDVDPHPHHDL